MNNIYNAIQNLYNMDKTTWQEVLAELYNLVANVENKFDLFELKFGSLLGEQVTRELKKMYDDGSLASLINDKLLKDINKKVDTFKSEVSEQLDTKASKENSIKWLNVVELGIDNTGVTDVSDNLQLIINNVPDYSTLYFPSGKYLFNKGITDNKRLNFIGDSYFITDIPRLRAGQTEFVTKGNSNITILNFTGGQHVVKGISFYSDSFTTTEATTEPTLGNPKYHWQTSKSFDNVNAIKDSTNLVGSYYENIYISGFSGIGIEMGYYSTLNNAMIFSCGLGLKSGIDSIVTNSKMWGCSDSAYIKVGTSLTNIRVEEVEKVGIKVEGSTKFNNVTIDQCGYCGLYLIDGAKEVSFSGKITRCSQYYFNTDFETYKTISGKIEEAFSLIYTNGYATDCTFVLIGSNKGNYKDGGSNLHTINILKGNLTDTKILINTDGENLVHYGDGNIVLINKDIFKYVNGSLFSKNGIDLTTNGTELIRHKNGRIYINDGNNNFNKSLITEIGLVLGSTTSNATNFGYAYGGTWVNVGSLTIGSETIYFHKKTAM